MNTTALIAAVGAIITFAGCAASPTSEIETEPTEARQIIDTTQAPAAIGPYSQAVQIGRHLYLSGQIGIDPQTGEMVAGGVEPETRQVLANTGAVLAAAGFSPADVVQSVVFLADMNDYAAVNEIYGEFFAGAPPARAAVQVARLPKEARVEIMMTAIRPGS